MSDRFFSPQPNVPGKGIVASYGPGFWTLVVAIGVIAGLGGAVLMLLLRAVEHLAWSYRSGTFLHAVQHVSALHRVLVLLAAGVIAGVGAVGLGRLRGTGGAEVSDALWLQDGRLAVRPSVGRGVLSIVIVALGTSVGREAAPQLTGAAAASWLCETAGIERWQRRLLVACGAGAGMAAVYNVPLGGALFALEVLLGTVTLPLVLPALLTTTIATAVAWIAVPDASVYTIPSYAVSASQITWAVIVGPLAGLAAVAWVRLIAVVNGLRPQQRMRVVAPIVVLTALGGLAIAYPQLLGNGKNTVQLAVTGGLGVGLLAVLLALKPLVTAACLGSGAPGGLFTPTLAYGVLFGGLLGHAWTALWPGAPAGSYALIGGGAVLAASMQGPLAAIVLIIELAHHSETLMVPLLLAVAGATVIARLLGAPSIYSARLGEKARRTQGGHDRAPQPAPPAPPRPDPERAGEESEGAGAAPWS
ncbi:MAG: chloride channel protein [Solirubrobacteraceae bacterium]